jgi:hypothetical protein
MGSIRRSSKKSTSTNATLGPYPDDGAVRMPVFNSTTSIQAARRRRQQVTTRSGRSSTRLATGDAGTRSYVGSLLGSAL